MTLSESKTCSLAELRQCCASLEENMAIVRRIETCVRREPADTRRLEQAQLMADAQMRALREGLASLESGLRYAVEGPAG